jgi:hypothetical protein
MADRYDKQIARLLAAPDFRAAVEEEWSSAKGLFAFVTPDRYTHTSENGVPYGCLTMIRQQYNGGHYRYEAYTDELTEAIRADDRLPRDVDEIEPRHLPVFAEWQRRIARELRNAKTESA